MEQLSLEFEVDGEEQQLKVDGKYVTIRLELCDDGRVRVWGDNMILLAFAVGGTLSRTMNISSRLGFELNNLGQIMTEEELEEYNETTNS